MCRGAADTYSENVCPMPRPSLLPTGRSACVEAGPEVWWLAARTNALNCGQCKRSFCGQGQPVRAAGHSFAHSVRAHSAHAPTSASGCPLPRAASLHAISVSCDKQMAARGHRWQRPKLAAATGCRRRILEIGRRRLTASKQPRRGRHVSCMCRP
jgi:hypothetical protein